MSFPSNIGVYPTGNVVSLGDLFRPLRRALGNYVLQLQAALYALGEEFHVTSGYLHGLRGQEIPVGARILSAVDCLDALATDRQYRPAMPLSEAMEVVIALSGTAYDPKVVEILKRRYLELDDRARSHGGVNQRQRLSTHTKIERGAAPAAGLDTTMAANRKPTPGDFLASIASARQEAQELFELAKDVGNSLSLEETLWMISARVNKMVPYDAICLFLVQDQLVKAAFANGENSVALNALAIQFGAGVSGWVDANRQPILNGSPLVEPGYRNPVGGLKKLTSVLAVPLEGLEGVVGVLALYRVESDAFSRDQLRILQAISQKVAAAIENARKFEQVKTSATTDYLTSLPNTRSLFLHLEGGVDRCSRDGLPLVVLVCDLDGFKQVNDRFGHLVGNQLLRELASQLANACRKYDYIARMGGDEFVVVLPGMDSSVLQNRIRAIEDVALQVGISVCSERVVSLSIGHAMLSQNTADATALLAEADRRMYRAKQDRKASRLRAIDDLTTETTRFVVQ